MAPFLCEKRNNRPRLLFEEIRYLLLSTIFVIAHDFIFDNAELRIGARRHFVMILIRI